MKTIIRKFRLEIDLEVSHALLENTRQPIATASPRTNSEIFEMLMAAGTDEYRAKVSVVSWDEKRPAVRS